MVVETSSSGKITTTGNPYIFRISPPSAVEAAAFKRIVDKLELKKVDFLVINNDWGRGTAGRFQQDDEGRRHRGRPGRDHGPGRAGHERAALKIKGSDSDTIIVTPRRSTSSPLIFKQAAALGLKKRIITTGGSQNPDQIIAQARRRRQRHHAPDDVPALVPGQDARSGSHQLLHQRNGRSAASTSPAAPKASVAMTASCTAAAAIEKAGRRSLRRSRRRCGISTCKGLNGDIVFQQIRS